VQKFEKRNVFLQEAQYIWSFAMKTVVLAEKPSVGRELARVLGCSSVSKTHIEGKDYIVTWAMGHLVEPADPDEYDEKWKKWDMQYLPMLPDTIKLKVIKRTSFQFNVIKSILKRPDVDNLIIATDAGREGELVARWIIKLCGYHGKLRRLWISSQTDAAIKEGFRNLKDGSVYDNLFHAAECRSEADWVIGLNVTRALSCKYDAKLSAGRVQTPTLGLIINRENEIKHFKPEAFWTVEALFDGFKAQWIGKNGLPRLKNKDMALGVVEKCSGKQAVIQNIDIEEKSELPPLAYDLTSLQGDANRILNFSAKHTLQVLQGLYERHKIVTYPRTDSKHITTDIVPTLKSRLKAIENTKFGPSVKWIISKDINPGKRFVDNSKVSDHHAIIPTEEVVNVLKLSSEERALWELIAKRFITVLYPANKYRRITVTLDVAGEKFIARGTESVELGWKAVTGDIPKTDDDNESDQSINLKNLQVGGFIHPKKISFVQGMTKPPARYTEGTLLHAMENAGKFIDDKVLKASIERGGLGTPATRADIIEKLFANYYIEKNGKELFPTSQGFELISVVPEQLKSPELTAEWELRFERIAKGLEKSNTFIKDIKNNAVSLIADIKSSSIEFKPFNESDTACPMCGKMLLTAQGKKGEKLLICRSRQCGYEQKEERDYSLKRNKSKQEKIVDSKLMYKYTDTNAKSTFTLGDLMNIKNEKNK